MERTAIYYRVSTDRQDLEMQRHDIERFLKDLALSKRPSSIIEYKDVGISGTASSRPGFDALLSAAFKGEIDTILVYRLDRFSRQASTAIQLILALDEAGVGFVSATQPVLNLGKDNPFRRTLLAAFAEIAEIERSTLISRVNSGLAAAKARGVQLGPPRKINDELRSSIENLRKNGHSIRYIAALTKVSVGAVSKILSTIKAQAQAQSQDDDRREVDPQQKDYPRDAPHKSSPPC